MATGGSSQRDGRRGRRDGMSVQERQAAWSMAGMGTELVGAIVGMTLIGWGIDRWLGTGPVLLLVGVVLGVVGGGWSFLRKALAMSDALAAKATREKRRYVAVEDDDREGDDDASADRRAAGSGGAPEETERLRSWERRGGGGEGWFARDEIEMEEDDGEVRFPPGFDDQPGAGEGEGSGR